METKVQIFSKANERINLILPAAFLLALIFGIQIESPFRVAFGDSAKLTQRLLVDILFLNVTHNAFTIMMLASFPELKAWTLSQGSGNTGRFWIKIGVIYCGLITLFLALLLSKSAWLHTAFILVSVFFPIQHALAQSLGLSLVYNRKTSATSTQVKIPEWWERRLVTALLVAIVGSIFALRWAPNSLEIQRGTFGLAQSSSLFYFALGIGVLLIATMFFYPKNIRGKKIAFAMRYPIWAYSLVTPLGLYATQVIHGLEYLFVVKKMASKSKLVQWSRMTIMLLLAVVVIGMFRDVFYDGYTERTTEAPIWLTIAAAISTAFSFLHYYLDRELFLMRRPLNRETVGKLLK